VEIGQDIAPYVGRDGVHHYGNYISDGEVSGVNFLEEYIFDYAKQRAEHPKEYETIRKDRLYNNLLSSQPMAFNLFCPLRRMLSDMPECATKAISAALPLYPIARVTEVELEFIPDNYIELTGDRSAMDAIICFEDYGGRCSFIAIETKYSENLGTNVARDNKRAISAIKELGCFKPDIEDKIERNKVRLTQIYRNFLVSETYGINQNKKAYAIVVTPQEHPTTGDEVNSLKNELKEEYRYKISSVNLEDFVLKLIEKSQGKYQATFRAFYDRYLNFEKNKIAISLQKR
jgi:hypothetical protein